MPYASHLVCLPFLCHLQVTLITEVGDRERCGLWLLRTHPIPHRSSQSARLSSLYTATSHQLSINILHMTVYICGEGNGTPLQYPCLENPMDGEVWWAAVREVAKSRIGLSNFAFTFHFHALEKEMATHSSVRAWRIPGTGEPGGLPSMGSHRVGHD